MAERSGMPLLSGPAPPPHDSSRADISCRRCNKEFNIIFTRARRCNHCGYNYCSSCSDYQALMPRSGTDQTGYDPVAVCAFCIENLTITAGGRNHLRSLSLARLKRYVDAYNIKAVGVLEKDDLIQKILAARGQNGCLPHANETFYRKYSVPNGRTGRPRGLFSRADPAPPPAPAPPRQANSTSGFARPDLDSSTQRQPPSQTRRPQPQSQPSARAQPYPPPRSTPPPMHSPRPQPAGTTYAPPPYPRPNTAHPTPQAPGAMPGNWTHAPPSRPASAAPAPPPQPPAPVPTLDELLEMSEDAISALSIGTLKSVLFQNHVNARLLLEKSDLVAKVRVLVDDERRERAREAAIHAREEEEIIARQHEMMEEHRVREEQARLEREARERDEAAARDEALPSANGDGTPPPSHKPNAPPTLPPIRPNAAADLERTGLCVICQDEEANIAIVDCGHLAMCRSCSDLVMSSSRECPLCRTRIVTEARLLRIFKT